MPAGERRVARERRVRFCVCVCLWVVTVTREMFSRYELCARGWNLCACTHATHKLYDRQTDKFFVYSLRLLLLLLLRYADSVCTPHRRRRILPVTHSPFFSLRCAAATAHGIIDSRVAHGMDNPNKVWVRYAWLAQGIIFGGAGEPGPERVGGGDSMSCMCDQSLTHARSQLQRQRIK